MVSFALPVDRMVMVQRLAPASRLVTSLGAAAVVLALLPGCGMSSLTSGLGSGILGGSPSSSTAKVDSVTEEQLLSAAKADEGVTGSTSAGEIAHGCPRFIIWPRDNHVTIYEQGRVGDGLAVVHRGEITKTARECQIEPGRVVVKYGFSGRVLLGPRGQTGTVSLPVTVYVTDAKREKIATDTLQIDVAVAVEKPIGYFSAVRTVTFPIAEGSRPGEYEVFVGFDRKVENAG
jgi:hypothetical protein